jgi:anti-anti-sigma regulatory factor
MSATGLSAKLVRGVPVIAAPVQVLAGNAQLLWLVLAEWLARGHATFVVDLSRTQACDRGGLGVLAGAHRRLQAEGGELRLAHCGPAVLARSGELDPSIRTFGSVLEAVSELPAAVIEPIRQAGSRLPSLYANAGPAVLASATGRR